MGQNRILDSNVYRAIFCFASDALCVLDGDLRFVDANLRACAILGWPCDELIQSNAFPAFPRDVIEQLLLLAKFQNSSDELVLQSTAITRSGECVPLLISACNIDAGSERFLLLRFGKLPEEIKISDDVDFLVKQLSQEREDLAAFFKILGFTELLLDRPENLDKKEKLKRYLEMINMAAQDCAKVVGRLREFYRHKAESDLFRPVTLHDLVQQAIDFTRPKWKDQALAQGLVFSFETDLQQVPPIMGNESELREMLINLIINAVDAMPAGGTIHVSSQASGDKVILQMSDTGTGMGE